MTEAGGRDDVNLCKALPGETGALCLSGHLPWLADLDAEDKVRSSGPHPLKKVQ